MDLPGLPIDPALVQPNAPSPKPTRDADEARRTAEDFEAFFITHMMEQMFVGLEPDALFGGGVAEGPLRSLMFQEYGKQMSHTRGVGIADIVQREILKMQEVT
jgi:Rod binding domain-containing protein